MTSTIFSQRLSQPCLPAGEPLARAVPPRRGPLFFSGHARYALRVHNCFDGGVEDAITHSDGIAHKTVSLTSPAGFRDSRNVAHRPVEFIYARSWDNLERAATESNSVVAHVPGTRFKARKRLYPNYRSDWQRVIPPVYCHDLDTIASHGLRFRGVNVRDVVGTLTASRFDVRDDIGTTIRRDLCREAPARFECLPTTNFRRGYHCCVPVPAFFARDPTALQSSGQTFSQSFHNAIRSPRFQSWNEDAFLCGKSFAIFDKGRA